MSVCIDVTIQNTCCDVMCVVEDHMPFTETIGEFEQIMHLLSYPVFPISHRKTFYYEPHFLSTYSFLTLY